MNGHLKMPVLQPLGFLTEEEGATALEYGLLGAVFDQRGDYRGSHEPWAFSHPDVCEH